MLGPAHRGVHRCRRCACKAVKLARSLLPASEPVENRLAPLALGARGFDLLLTLIQHGDRVVTKERARAPLERVLADHPAYAPAWAWLALLNANRAGLETTESLSSALLKQTIDCAFRARTLDPRHPAAWRALGFAHSMPRSEKPNTRGCARRGHAASG